MVDGRGRMEENKLWGKLGRRDGVRFEMNKSGRVILRLKLLLDVTAGFVAVQ